jgi:hypothetical protein
VVGKSKGWPIAFIEEEIGSLSRISSSPTISAQMSSNAMWPKNSQPLPNPDDKYKDWIRIPPPDSDPSTDALPKSEQGDPKLWVLASLSIPAFWLLLLFLAWFFAGPGREDRDHNSPEEPRAGQDWHQRSK